MGIRIEPMTLSDLAEVLADHDEFWGGRDTRFLHQQVFVQEFGDTCLTARGAGDRIAGYLLGFTTPRRSVSYYWHLRGARHHKSARRGSGPVSGTSGAKGYALRGRGCYPVLGKKAQQLTLWMKKLKFSD